MEKIYIHLLKQATPVEKLITLAELNDSARLQALTSLRFFPQAKEAELQRRLAGLILGEDLANKVYKGSDKTA